jgi:hypothetical protein
LDVLTRWNNTYKMLTITIRFKEVFPRFSSVDTSFQWVISPKEWDRVENVNKILAMFNVVTNIASRSDYTTSNLFLPEVWRVKEIPTTKSE